MLNDNLIKVPFQDSFNTVKLLRWNTKKLKNRWKANF